MGENHRVKNRAFLRAFNMKSKNKNEYLNGTSKNNISRQFAMQSNSQLALPVIYDYEAPGTFSLLKKCSSILVSAQTLTKFKF